MFDEPERICSAIITSSTEQLSWFRANQGRYARRGNQRVETWCYRISTVVKFGFISVVKMYQRLQKCLSQIFYFALNNRSDFGNEITFLKRCKIYSVVIKVHIGSKKIVAVKKIKKHHNISFFWFRLIMFYIFVADNSFCQMLKVKIQATGSNLRWNRKFLIDVVQKPFIIFPQFFPLRQSSTHFSSAPFKMFAE